MLAERAFRKLYAGTRGTEKVATKGRRVEALPQHTNASGRPIATDRAGRRFSPCHRSNCNGQRMRS